MAQPREPELDPALEEHLFGEVESARPVKRMRVARERKEIRLGPDLRRIVDECIEALSADPRTFSRANELVTIVGAPPERPRSFIAQGTPIIRPMNAGTTIERLTDFARLVKYNSKFDRWDEQPAPERIANMMLSRGDWLGVRPLIGVVETPLFRPDGTIRQERGYDAATGYVYLPSADYPAIPDHPTQDEAKRALDDLLHVFCDFPYVDDSHRMVPIAAILTILARSAIDGPVPAFLFDASVRGSGKSLQADIVHLVSFGRRAARKTYPEDDDELDKVLAACALSGARCVLLDNVTREFGGGSIDAYLTSVEIEFRILGVTRIMRLPWLAALLVSGNNLAIGEDTMRRVLVSRLESPLENPEERVAFAHPSDDDPRDLPTWVRDERPRLVSAAMTILRAYAAVGWPDAGCPRWGSFESWSHIIPGAIVFAGGQDPMRARPTGDGALTDDLMALRIVLNELPRLAPEGITARDLVHRLYAHREPDAAPDEWDRLREAIEVWAPARVGSTPDARKLGIRLRRFKGRILGGKRLAGVSVHGGSSAWRVVKV